MAVQNTKSTVFAQKIIRYPPKRTYSPKRTWPRVVGLRWKIPQPWIDFWCCTAISGAESATGTAAAPPPATGFGRV
eukprot:1876111-Prymnesium_polylepis.1